MFVVEAVGFVGGFGEFRGEVCQALLDVVALFGDFFDLPGVTCWCGEGRWLRVLAVPLW